MRYARRRFLLAAATTGLLCAGAGPGAAVAAVAELTAGCDEALALGPEREVAVAEFFVRQKRLPLPAEIAKKGAAEGSPAPLDEARIEAALFAAIRGRPELFAAFRARAEQHIGGFFTGRLRLPTPEETAGLINLREKPALAARIVESLFGDHPVRPPFARASAKLVEAYFTSMSQGLRPQHLRMEPKPPTLEELFRTLVQIKNNHVLLEDVLDGRFTIQSLKFVVEGLGGLGEIEALARIQNPARFGNFQSAELNSDARRQRLLHALETKAGFLITSVNAGMEDEEAQLATMLKYADDIDYDIIVVPTNRYTEGLSSTVLNHPRIHVLMNTFENSHLKLDNIGILPKNKDPFASLDGPGQFEYRQIVIVGSPKLRHRVIATGTNHLRSTTLWSTGSMSRNVYPYRFRVQARTSRLAHGSHQNGFLVLAKSDAGAGLDGRGVPNLWHEPRNVFFRNHEMDPTPGFTDLGREYYYVDGTVKTRSHPFDVAVGGDLHESESDTATVGGYRQLLDLAPPNSVDFVIHDAINATGAGRHDFHNVPRLIENFRSGKLDLKVELGGLVQFDNALARIPSVRARHYVDSNHSYWLDTLLEKRPEANTVINGDIMAEFYNAQTALTTKKPLEYILNGRPGYVQKLEPSVRHAFEQRDIMIEDPGHARVIPFGEPFFVGTAWRQVALHFHGHQGAGGARPSPRTHAMGSAHSLGGDSHQTAILGGYINVGTSTPKKMGYNDGGYSSWVQGCGVVYPDGTAQLLIYDSDAGTFFPRPEKGFLPGKSFFAGEPLRIVPNDNDLVPDGNVEDQFSTSLEVRRRVRSRGN